MTLWAYGCMFVWATVFAADTRRLVGGAAGIGAARTLEERLDAESEELLYAKDHGTRRREEWRLLCVPAHTAGGGPRATAMIGDAALVTDCARVAAGGVGAEGRRAEGDGQGDA